MRTFCSFCVLPLREGHRRIRLGRFSFFLLLELLVRDELASPKKLGCWDRACQVALPNQTDGKVSGLAQPGWLARHHVT